jgi:hypothetical protein
LRSTNTCGREINGCKKGWAPWPLAATLALAVCGCAEFGPLVADQWPPPYSFTSRTARSVETPSGWDVLGGNQGNQGDVSVALFPSDTYEIVHPAWPGAAA